ncbi:MAG TPA: hypothetical protein ENI49_02065, partial [Thermoplasmatales archaeon]|nr:hypothetical protein [Thermoplasmatales archaeon]
MIKKLLIVGSVFLILTVALTLIAGVTQAGDEDMWHKFYGTAQDMVGKNISDGIEVRAIVVDGPGDTEEYTKTIINGTYGYYLPSFYVKDPERNNKGKPIYFYIGLLNTTQSTTFVAGGLNENWNHSGFNLTVEDVPRITDNSPSTGYTGDPFTFNVTIGEYVDSGDELTVKVNWTHGTHAGFVNNNDTMICTGGDNINGFYFEKTITLDNYSIADLVYTIYVNDTSGNSNSSGPHSVHV